MCVYNTKGRGCWTDPGQGLGAEPGGWAWGLGNAGGLEAWLAGWGGGWSWAGLVNWKRVKSSDFPKAEKNTKKRRKKNWNWSRKKGKWLCFFVFLVWIVFFCGMNCVFFWAFLWYESCFLLVLFFVIWIVFFCAFFVVWIVFFCFFCGMNCVFFVELFLWYELCFFLGFFWWYELCFFCALLWYELCFFCAFFCGMNCGIFLCSFLCFFFVLGSAGKAQRQAQKKHTKSTKKAQQNQHFFGKNESQASCPRQPSDQRPSKCLPPFPFSNLLSKKNSQEWAHARSGNVKKCNYHMMFIKNLNNYCWRHAFVAPFTYNLQWLDRLIAVSRYLRYAAFNIVKNVMSQNIVSWYWCNTLNHHTISLPLLFDTQIFR